MVINKVLDFERDNINMPSIFYAKLAEKISYLVAEGFVGQDIQLAMNSVRKIGNKGAHDGSDITYPDVFSAHKMLTELLYGFWNFIHLNTLKLLNMKNLSRNLI